GEPRLRPSARRRPILREARRPRRVAPRNSGIVHLTRARVFRSFTSSLGEEEKMGNLRIRTSALCFGAGVAFAALVSAAAALAEDAAAAPKFDTGDTAWMLTSSALVLMMTIPGLALFYGGLVRPKNVLSTLMHSFFCASLISVTWVLFGYSMAFGPDVGGIVGSAAHFGLREILGTANSAAPTIPQMVFVAFQPTFPIITPSLISSTF